MKKLTVIAAGLLPGFAYALVGTNNVVETLSDYNGPGSVLGLLFVIALFWWLSKK